MHLIFFKVHPSIFKSLWCLVGINVQSLAFSTPAWQRRCFLYVALSHHLLKLRSLLGWLRYLNPSGKEWAMLLNRKLDVLASDFGICSVKWHLIIAFIHGFIYWMFCCFLSTRLSFPVVLWFLLYLWKD